MGAYIHTDTGRVLFVASGVERPDPIGAGSTDCEAFQNYRYLDERFVGIVGKWCPRPEIGDFRRMALGISKYDSDSLVMFFSYKPSPAEDNQVYFATQSSISYEPLHENASDQAISGEFSYTAANRDPPYDTILVTDGRFDVTYGLTP